MTNNPTPCWTHWWFWFAWLALAFTVFLVWEGISIFNQLWIRWQFFQEARGNISALLRKRQALYPQLRSVFWAFLQKEQQTHGFVAYCRAHWPSSSARRSSPNKAEARQILFGLEAVQLLALTEAFPKLKAYLPAQDILREISAVEDQLAQARALANAAAQGYNSFRGMFPNILVAWLTNMKEAGYTELPEDSSPPPAEFPMPAELLPPLDTLFKGENQKENEALVGEN